MFLEYFSVTVGGAMESLHEEFCEYLLKNPHLVEHFYRVIAACRILGLKCDEIAIDSVEAAYQAQLVSPGVHANLAKEMEAARLSIVNWIQENPDWRQLPRF